MSENNEYTGSKVKNHFTAYLIGFIHGKRRHYLQKKIKISNSEKPLDEFALTEMGQSIEESLELQQKEEVLIREAEGCYLKWNELSDQKLMKALMNLREDERKLIYQHVFEEQTFIEMSLINGIPEEKAKGVYYYAIRKIRKMMGGE